ncbi:MAG: hypothetical protein WA913_09240 [Pricia sp.]
MKAIIILLTVLTFGATALANTETDDKIDGIEMGIVLVGSTDRIDNTAQIEVDTENCVARLYKFQNSRVKKALTFTTKRTRAKLV